MLRELGAPLLIHQPSYSMLNRWIETEGLLDAAAEVGAGVIGFTALAQGVLTGKYLDGIPEGSRATQGKSLDPQSIDETLVARLNALNDVAKSRGQSLAQLALAWALRDPRMTSLVVGASSVRQLDQNVAALDNLAFGDDELAAIDTILLTPTSSVDLWRDARRGTL